MRGVVLLAVSVLVLMALPFAGLGADGDGGPGAEAAPDLTLASSVGTTTSHLVWSTATTGDLAIRMELRFDSHEQCGFRIASAGWMSGNSLFQYTANDRPGGLWTAVTERQLLHAHGGNLAVRSGTSPNDIWIAQAFHGFSVFGASSWLYAGVDTTPVDHPWTGGNSVVFDLECTGPFTITKIEGGRNLLLASPQFVTGGAGASLATLGVNAADGATHVFGTPHVAFRAKTDPAFETGLIQVSGPAATTRLLGGDTDVHLDGPGGLWGYRLTRAALDTTSPGGFRGAIVLAGLQDVQSLDEAASL